MTIDPADRRVRARASELLVLATIVAAVLWGLFLIDASSGTGRGRLSGLPIGTDFVAFYTYAHVGLERKWWLLTSAPNFIGEQIRLVPDAADTPHPPLYPAQVALLLAPLATLTYWHAYALWVGLSVLLYVWCIWIMGRSTTACRRFPAQTVAVAAANPALWMLVMHGQLASLALAALVLAWAALEHRRPLLAGLAVGLLAYKVTQFIPAVALCLLAAEWWMVAGALVGAVLQYLVFLLAVGVQGLHSYGLLLSDLARTPDLVAGNPAIMHSLRALWAGLLPPMASQVMHGLSAAGALWLAAIAWRRATLALVRIGVLAMAIVLASPHVYVYDLVLLTPLALASAQILVGGRGAPRLAPLTYAGYLAPLWGIPFAVAGIHLTPVAFIGWLASVAASSSSEIATGASCAAVAPAAAAVRGD